MDCLIFGAYGYLGSRIYDYFNNFKNKVVIGTQNKTQEVSKNFSIIENYKSLNEKELSKIIKQFDLVIDATGISGGSVFIEDKVEVIKSNTLWPSKLAKVCIEMKTKLVWFSTYHCENLKIDNQDSVIKGIYALSKLLAESSIMNQPNWDKYITIARLGNILGSPGSIYLGKSKLFVFEIVSDLINNKKAIIKSDAQTRIGFVPISQLFNSQIFNYPGFYRIYNLKKNSIYSITKSIQKNYEELSGEKTKIIFNKKNNKIKLEFVPLDIKKEIESIIVYFLKKNL